MFFLVNFNFFRTASDRKSLNSDFFSVSCWPCESSWIAFILGAILACNTRLAAWNIALLEWFTIKYGGSIGEGVRLNQLYFYQFYFCWIYMFIWKNDTRKYSGWWKLKINTKPEVVLAPLSLRGHACGLFLI